MASDQVLGGIQKMLHIGAGPGLSSTTNTVAHFMPIILQFLALFSVLVAIMALFMYRRQFNLKLVLLEVVNNATLIRIKPGRIVGAGENRALQGFMMPGVHRPASEKETYLIKDTQWDLWRAQKSVILMKTGGFYMPVALDKSNLKVIDPDVFLWYRERYKKAVEKSIKPNPLKEFMVPALNFAAIVLIFFMVLLALDKTGKAIDAALSVAQAMGTKCVQTIAAGG